MFTPLLSAADLPAIDVDHETLHLDFKATAAGSTSWEKAKDAAAFANAQGGVILVSAAEDKRRGVIGRYRFMTQSDAASVRAAFDEAIRTRCRPQPVFDVGTFDVHGKGFAVAVNVWPFIGQPVGVFCDLAAEEKAVPAFAFPVRVGTGTIYLTADQLPMFMQPEIRRIAILLLSIPVQERNNVLLMHMNDRDGTRGNEASSDIRLLLDDQNVLLKNTLRIERASSRIHIPIDCITRIWQNWDDRWVIRAKVAIRPDGRGGHIAQPPDW